MNGAREPRKALNKAFLKVKVSRSDIEKFKANFVTLLDHINEKESEEFHKNLMADFLKNTYYRSNYFINTRERNDLVIHNQKEAKSSVGVILEVKKPKNKAEMVKRDNLNDQALQELVSYFLRERITHKNLEIKYLIITNIYEWFIFDAQIFEKCFFENKKLIEQFEDFEARRLTGTTTEFFYKEIAKPAIEAIKDELIFTYFDIREYEQIVRNNNPVDDEKLIALFKLLSPQHLLKLPIANDSNTLDKGFYSELLYIIGLTEAKEKNKKLIKRQPQDKQTSGSLIENAISQLDSLDKISRLENPEQFGETEPEQLFNIALELSITWINRILFLKLLESQLISYHKSEGNFAFLNSDKIHDFGDLDRLFFQVLAVKTKERKPDLQIMFSHVPYLNSSLFEPTELEHQTIVISNLREEKLPIFSSTVLKDANGNKRTGELNTLQYLFEFLDAYDFSSEGLEGIQDEQKTLINASVLGLIFEKINGYKDGSYFTPGFITMYMCRETLRKAVIQQFNEIKGWNCETLDDLYDKIEDKTEVNQIINRLKICDPAVGSGHFLVSALNELIAIKHDLKILQDKNGRRLKEYQITVENDELMITDKENQPFTYTPKSRESQRIQETLFHEKQTIIENCLFGVDINPNSVNICRLRLWIELLKNAYYKADTNYTELETLPNIDINIKCGNSLISRFPLNADLKPALKNNKIDIETYHNTVKIYRHAENKQQKREIETLMNTIKGNFKTTLQGTDPNKTKLRQLEGELDKLENQLLLFEETKAEQKAREKKIAKLNLEIDKLRVEIAEIESGKLYENAFEWRFEFPEVLDDTGRFIGFDVVIGNPPYIGGREWGLTKTEFNYYLKIYKAAEYQFDAYILFFELATILCKNFICYITPNTWLNNQKTSLIREIILQYNLLEIADYSKTKVFKDATVLPVITLIQKNKSLFNPTYILVPHPENVSQLIHKCKINQSIWNQDELKIINIDLIQSDILLKEKIEQGSQNLGDLATIKFGVKVYQTGKGRPKQTPDAAKNKIFEAKQKLTKQYLPYIKGRNINKYSYEWDQDWLDYGEHLAEPRNIDLFQGQRLLVRRIVGETLIATYLDEDLITGQLLQIVKPENPNLSKILLGIINSKLIAYYFRKKYNKQDIVFPEIRIYELFSLPIKIPENQSIFFKYIDKIIVAKKLYPNADTTTLEQQIDQLVYQLYGLTEAEIKIVEGITDE